MKNRGTISEKKNATQNLGCDTIKIHATVAAISHTMQTRNRPLQYNALDALLFDMNHDLLL